MESSQETIIIGKVAGHFGVNGWIKIKSYTRPAHQITEYRQLIIEQGTEDRHRDVHEDVHEDLRGGGFKRVGTGFSKAVEVSDYRQGKVILAKLKGYDSREDSDELIGNQVLIRRDQLQPLTEGEYYWMDIIGSKVVNTKDVVLGTVVEMMETGANDVMVVRTRSADVKTDVSEAERLIPWIDDVFLGFDTMTKVIRVDWEEDF